MINIIKPAHEEFDFLRDRLEKIASLLIKGEPQDIKQASFMVGCLHNVCCMNAMIYKTEEKMDLNFRP